MKFIIKTEIASYKINVAIIIFSNFLILQLFPMHSGAGWFLLRMCIIAIVLILAGEVMPKMWASQSNLWFAYSVSPVIEVIHYLFRRVGGRFKSKSGHAEAKKAERHGLGNLLGAVRNIVEFERVL